MKISNSVSVSKFNILFYAVPGAGKTVLVASAVDVKEFGPVLVLDTDKGLRSVAHLGDKLSHVSISSSKEYEEAIAELAGDKGKAYRTVIMDSVTELAAIVLAETVAAAVAKGGRRTDIDAPELLDYKLLGAKLLRLLRLTRNLPHNVLFTAKAQKVMPKDADGLEISGAKPTEIFPALPKKVREELAGMVDAMCYLNQESDGSRKLYTQQLGPVHAKNRIAGVPAVIDNPTMKCFDTKKESK